MTKTMNSKTNRKIKMARRKRKDPNYVYFSLFGKHYRWSFHKMNENLQIIIIATFTIASVLGLKYLAWLACKHNGMLLPLKIF